MTAAVHPALMDRFTATSAAAVILHGDVRMVAAARRALAVLGQLDAEEVIDSEGSNGATIDATMLLQRIQSQHGPHLLVQAADAAEATYLRQLARECAVAALPWVVAQRLGPAWAVGPLFVPGQSACFECLVLRTLASRDSAMLAGSWPTSASSGSRIDGSDDTSLTEIAAAILAHELLAYRRDGRQSLMNAVWLVRADPLRVSVHRVLRIPGCPVCSLARNASAAQPQHLAPRIHQS